MARKSKKSPTSSPSLRNDGWWDGLPGRTQHLICLLVLLAVAIGFYAPVLFSGMALIGGDTVNWRAMAEYMIRYQEETGRQALWAPNAFAGMPGYMVSYGEQIPQLDDIPALLREVIWPASHFIFLLLGTYLLVFFLTRDRLAGVFSATAYGLTTYLAVILVAGHNSKFISLCFAPWLVLAFAYTLRKPKLLSGLLFAVALGANLRAGHVQITYYISMLLGIWWIVELVGSIRRRDWRPFAAATGWLAVGSFLGLLLVAQPYLANFEYKRYTIRGAVGEAASGLDWSYAMGWSQGVGELITLIAADTFGGASPTYWGPKPFTSGPHYVGAVVLLFAVFAVWRWRRNVVTAFGIGTIFMVLFSLGEHLPILNRLMYEHFPLFNAFRVPETWLSAVAFALAVLGGIGLAVVRKDHTPAGDRVAFASAGGVAALLLFFLLVGGSLFDFERPNEEALVTQQLLSQRQDVSPDDPRVQATVRQYVEQQKEERSDVFSDELMRALLFALAAGGLLVLYRTGKIPGWTLQAAVVLLVVIDLWSVGRRYMNEDQLVRAAEVEDRIPTYDFDQFLIQEQEQEGGPGHFRVLSLESGNPFTNARPSYHHESIGGYHGAKLRLIQDYIDEIFVDPETRGPNENALDLLNVRYVIAGGRLPGTEVVYQSAQSGMYVLENEDAVPRAYFVGETEVIPESEEAWSRIRSDAFDPRQTVILAEPIVFETTPIDSAGTVAVDLQEYSPREIVWSVETDAPRLLVASEIYYPAGWTATVDGDEVPIYRANYLLRAVPVPEGRHTVTMRFEPSSHRVGVWVSGIATVLVYGTVLGLLGLGWYRRSRTEPSS